MTYAEREAENIRIIISDLRALKDESLDAYADRLEQKLNEPARYLPVTHMDSRLKDGKLLSEQEYALVKCGWYK